jgi:uncharacterized protein DUF2637
MSGWTVQLLFRPRAGPDFSERDRALLALLRPHPRQAPSPPHGVTPGQYIRGNDTMTRSPGGHVPASGGRWSAVLLTAVLLAVEAVIVAESWRGLTGFAHLIGISGVAAWGVPVTLDGVPPVAALVALRAELAVEASGLYRAVLSAFTAAPAVANYWHGHVTGGQQVIVTRRAGDRTVLS